MPKTKKLTAKGLQALRPRTERYEVPDPDHKGLFIRVSTTGRRTFIYRYQIKGKRRKMNLGDLGFSPTETLADAIALHSRLAAKARKGIDPQQATQPKETAYTIREIAEEFRDRHLKPNVATWEETWRILEKDVLPKWGDRQADSITPREVVTLLDGVLDRGAARMANKIRSILFQMYRFAIGRGMANTSPLIIVARPGGNTTTRERILSEDEIKIFWGKIDNSKIIPRLRHALRLLLITGQRRGEVALAKWEEFDLDAKVWNIPADRTKNKKAHIVPLTETALNCLKDLRADLDAAAVVAGLDEDGRYTGPWLFPSKRWGTGEPIDPKAITRAVSRNRQLWGIPAFTAHDLRRTVRSNLAALGVSPIVARKVVNHTLDGMDAIYDRHTYEDEKRAALELWCDHLRQITAGKSPKVVAIRNKRKKYSAG